MATAKSTHNAQERPRYHVEALARGLAVLTLFTPEEPWLSQTEIARRTGLSPATTVRFVTTLKKLGYLEQSPETRKYRPALAVLNLGYAALASLDVRELAAPILQRLSASTQETASMAVLAGTEIVWIERADTKDLVTTRVQVGSRLPAYATSMGKVLLAFLPEEQRDRLIAQMELVPLGPKTITSAGRLREELERIRAAGYAVQDEELAAGSRNVAAPVFDRASEAIAAINISAPPTRVPLRDAHGRLRRAVMEAAGEVSALLGFRPPAETRLAGVG
jgi:IclR family pca regulon transcriptional regulator